MPSFSFKSLAIAAVLTTGLTNQVAAQDTAQDTTQDTVEIPVVAEQIAPTQVKKRVVRIVEPVPYWVEADQLRVRDNPYAGDVVGMLEIGQKIRVRQTIDDWVRISAKGKPERWVNRKFLSRSPVTWANYSLNSQRARKFGADRFGSARSDIKKKRIKIKGVKDLKVYATDIKRLAAGKKLVISRHEFRAGPYYEKRIVQCAEDTASHVRILGEGYTVMMMEADPRHAGLGTPMADDDQVENEALSTVDKVIASFTCETEKL